MSIDVTLPDRAPRPVALHGPTGPLQVTLSRGGLTWTIPIVVVVGSLEVKVTPDILLSANLPDGIRGYPYSGSITAIDVGGATGDITITVDELPAGLVLGETVADGQSYTATITGTLQ